MVKLKGNKKIHTLKYDTLNNKFQKQFSVCDSINHPSEQMN